MTPVRVEVMTLAMSAKPHAMGSRVEDPSSLCLDLLPKDDDRLPTAREEIQAPVAPITAAWALVV